MSERVLITGAGGFVGGYLCELLESAGQIVTAPHYSPAADLTSFAYAVELVQRAKPEIIYHLASLSQVEASIEESTRILSNNSLLTLNLLEATRLYAPHARVITISSGNVYGLTRAGEPPLRETSHLRPLNIYAVSKLSQEYLSLEYHYAHKLDVIILRPFNHTGPGQSPQFVVPALAKQIAAIKGSGKIKVGNLDSSRDFTHVRDMVRAYHLASIHCQPGEIYNIGSGHSHSVRQIITSLGRLAGVEAIVESDSDKKRSNDVSTLVCDSSKFSKQTGWTTSFTFEQTLRDVLQYWQGQL